jgi:hypothetical protein
MIRSWKFRLGRMRTTVAWALILVLFGHATSLTAQHDCQVLDKYGEPRDCTWTEELASCNLDVFDSWEQCMENADSWFDRIACEATGVADTAACIGGAAVGWIGDLF